MKIMQKARMLFSNNAWDEYIRSFIRGDDAPPNLNGMNINSETAMKYTVVFACVRVLSETLAGMPIMLYRKKPDGDRETKTDLMIYDVLHNAPNDEMTPFSFKESGMISLNTGGNAVSQKIVNALGDVIGLYPYPWSAVSINRDKNTGKLVYEITGDDNQKKILRRDQVFHVSGLSLDGVIGVSPITYAASAIRLGLSYEQYGVNFYKNGASPSGIFSFPGTLTDPAFQRLKEELNKNYAGVVNIGKPMILEGEGKFLPVSIAPVDAQLLESKKFQTEDIARIYRVPLHLIQNLDRATFCLPADVEVMTEHGPKSIATICKGEKVWSLDMDRFVLAEVERSECTGNDEILEIRTENRSIRANAKHPILIRRKISDPKPGRGGYQTVRWENMFVPAGDLVVGDTIVTMSYLPDGDIENINERKLSIGFMEFCGLLIGDGNVFDGSVTIARGNNALYMGHYREVIKQEFVSYGNRGNGKGAPPEITPVSLREEERQTRFSSVLAVKELKGLGLSGDARSKRVPDWVFTVTTPLKLAFIRGYLDADGSVDKKGRASFASVNMEMLSQIRMLCMSTGIPVTNICTREAVSTLPNGKRFDCIYHTFTCSDPEANKKIWSHDPRYQERLLSGKPFGRKSRNYPRFGGIGFDLKGCGLSRIVSIKKQKIEPVYDLCVSGTHSFIANGIVVHNSNIEQQSLEFIMYTMLPWFKRWEEAINMQLLTRDQRKDGYYFEFKIDSLLRGDAKSRAEAYATGRLNGWLSINDIRKLENMNKIEHGDEYMQPLNYINVKLADEYYSNQSTSQKQNKTNAIAEEILEMLKNGR